MGVGGGGCNLKKRMEVRSKTTHIKKKFNDTLKFLFSDVNYVLSVRMTGSHLMTGNCARYQRRILNGRPL